ncbi:MAG: Crp/Fnr family transcriptional regulator [Actinomycetota bacterium]
MVSTGAGEQAKAPVRVLPGIDHTGNRLLDALPLAERDALVAKMEVRGLQSEEPLYEAGQRIKAVWFPITAIVSLLTTLNDGTGVETATVGREGMVGVAIFLGDDQVPNSRGVVQLRGEALRMDAADFGVEVTENPTLRQFLFAYTRALLLQFGQGVACATSHTVRERLARWMLQTTDRVANDELELTQQFLSEILGVRRASITAAIHELQNRGAITTRRGSIHVVRRDRLAEASCECYDVVSDEYERLLPNA